MKKHKITIEAVQCIVGCLLAYLGHPYVGVLIAAVHF